MGERLGQTHELVSARLHKAGQLYTKGRRELVELLVRTARRATIPEMLELRPRLTQSSLYRNMADLESLGSSRGWNAMRAATSAQTSTRAPTATGPGR